MSLDINIIEEKGETAKITLTGSLDSETYALLELELSVLPDAIKVIVLDMKELSFISSAGLRVIFATLKRLKSRGGKLAVVNMSPGVTKVFDIVQALPNLQVFGNDEEMDAYLSEFQGTIN